MEEREITIEYDITAEDALNIIFLLLKEIGIKYEYDGEGTIKYYIKE